MYILINDPRAAFGHANHPAYILKALAQPSGMPAMLKAICLLEKSVIPL